jgi:hypothetical protein
MRVDDWMIHDDIETKDQRKPSWANMNEDRHKTFGHAVWERAPI